MTVGLLSFASPAVQASLLKLNLSYDASWSGAPTLYQTDIVTAANMLMAAFPNTNITLTIQVGYGELEGSAVGASSSGASDIFDASVSFTAIKTAMAAITSPPAALASAVAALPSGTTLGGQTLHNVPWATCKTLGLYGFTSGPTGPNDTSQFDGAIGVGSGWGSTKTVGMFLHELSHAMGRIAGRAPFCFTRFVSAGVWDASSSRAGTYFSLDGGTTNLANYDGSSDFGDFANSVGDGLGNTDSFDAQQVTPIESLTTLDIQLMQAMGYR